MPDVKRISAAITKRQCDNGYHLPSLATMVPNWKSACSIALAKEFRLIPCNFGAREEFPCNS